MKRHILIGHPKGARIAQRLAQADGVVLLWALLIMFVLSIATAGTIQLVTSNEQAFGRDNRSTSSLNIAEAGLNAAFVAIKTASDTTTTASGNGGLDNGTWSYTASRAQDPTDSTKFVWTVASTGVLGASTHVVQEKLGQTIATGTQTGPQTTTTPASGAYGYGIFFGAGSSDCAVQSPTGAQNTLTGSGTLNTSTYVAGSLCLSGGAYMLEPASSSGGTLSLYVGGKLMSTSEAASVGTTTKHIAQATVVGGCVDGNHTTGTKKADSIAFATIPCSQQGNPTSCTSCSDYGSGVYANAYSSTQDSIPKPTIDTGWYTNAAPGPTHGCNGSSSYPSNQQSGTPQWTAATFNHKLFDGDSTRNTSVGTVDPLQLVNNWNQIMNSFDCKYYDSSGTLVGELKWTYPLNGMSSSNPGSLYVSGTVFIDGNLSFGSSDYAVYQGTGTIYVNGTVSIGNGAKICAKPSSGDPCQGNFDPSQNMLEIVAVNAGNATTGWTMSGSGTYEGIAFLSGTFDGEAGSSINGSVIADTGTLSGANVVENTINPPSGSPGAATTTTTTVTTSTPDQVSWSEQPGTWQQLQ